MGNTTSLGEDFDIFSLCIGESRKEDDAKKVALPTPLEDDLSKKSSPKSFMTDSTLTGKTPTRSARKSTAELAEVGMSDGETKQRYLKHASLDDAFNEGLISADDYAQNLRRIDGPMVTQDEEPIGTTFKDSMKQITSLDDAFAQGLLTADEYASQLRRMDSLNPSETQLIGNGDGNNHEASVANGRKHST